MTAELTPAHEARLEAFKRLFTTPLIVFSQTKGTDEAVHANLQHAIAEYERLLGELAAAQAAMLEQVGSSLNHPACILIAETNRELRKRAEVAEAEVARLTPAVIGTRPKFGTRPRLPRRINPMPEEQGHAD